MAYFSKVVPVLKVTSMQASVDYYTGVLGFEVLWRAPQDGGGENCMVGAGAVNLLLSTGAHLGDEPRFTGTLYVHTDGVRDFYERVKDRVDVVWPLEDMEYGQREFGLRDCNGYTLAFAESVDRETGAP